MALGKWPVTIAATLLPLGALAEFDDARNALLTLGAVALLAAVVQYRRRPPLARDADLIHDLRAPLYRLDGYGALLANSALSPSQRQQLTEIRAGAAQLNQLVNVLLGAAVQADTEALEALMVEQCRGHAGHAHGLGCTIRLQFDESCADLRAEYAFALRRIVSNLLTNAIEHGADSTVTVSVDRCDVPGVAPIEPCSARGRRRRASTPTPECVITLANQVGTARRIVPGRVSGRGLQVVERLAVQIGAELTISSEHGCYEARLALPMQSVARQPLRQRRSLYVSDTLHPWSQRLRQRGATLTEETRLKDSLSIAADDLVITSSKSDSADASARPRLWLRSTPANDECANSTVTTRSSLMTADELERCLDGITSAGGHVALVVDDQPYARRLLADSLVRCGFAVIEAESVREAIHATARRAIPYVLSDLRLADGSGLDLAEHLARLPQPPRVFAIVSASPASLPLPRSVNAWIEKPLSEARLRTLLGGRDEPEWSSIMATELASIATAIDACDYNSVEHLCHRTRGLCLIYRQPRVADALACIEQLAASESSQLPQAMAELDRRWRGYLSADDGEAANG